MQMVVQYALLVYQIDIVTEYLHISIDCKIFKEQQEKFEIVRDTTKTLVYKLNKSLLTVRPELGQTITPPELILHKTQHITHCTYIKHNN